MKRKLAGAILAVVAGFVVASSDANAGCLNAALNKPVTANGTFFTGGWGGGLTVPYSTIVDGTFLPKNTQWDQGAVWWDANYSNGSQYLQIDLQGIYEITDAIVQADDNDSYTLLYRDLSSGNWLTAWNIPTSPAYGMQTRPNSLNDTQKFTLASAITTDALRITHNQGDNLYSVSEVQAFGCPVPEPTVSLLGLMGVGSLLGFRKRK